MTDRRRGNKSKKKNKIVKYRKPLNFNIGMAIFAVIFIYIVICVVMYLQTKHIIGYEVTTGSLSISNVYEGVAIRDEIPVSANSSGYINYFAREGSHVASGDLIYTLDQSGTIADLIDSGDSSVMLSDDDLKELKSDIIVFDHGFDETEFSSVYDFKYSLEGSALKMTNYNMLGNMDQVSAASGSVDFCYAPSSGTVVYSADGLENLSPSAVTKETFESEKHPKKQLISNELVGTDDMAYKIIVSEDWSVMIPVTEERAAAMEEEGYVEVKFLKNQYSSWASVSIMRLSNGIYAKLDFNNSMSTFATDRYINIEILDNTEVGLKIPVSAIVDKEFYMVPKEYLVKGSNSSENGFLVETYNEDGTVSQVFTEAKIYSESDTDYYVDTSFLKIGSYICKENSTDKYAISKTGSLVGVFNINKGYADFTEITILSENEEYAIVKSNTRYGLAEYDHIVLEAESVSVDDFVR